MFQKLLNRLFQVIGTDRSSYQTYYLPCIHHLDNWLTEHAQDMNKDNVMQDVLKHVIKMLSHQRGCVIPFNEMTDNQINQSMVWQYAVCTVVLIYKAKQFLPSCDVFNLVKTLLPQRGLDLLQANQALYEQWLAACSDQGGVDNPFMCLLADKLSSSSGLTAKLPEELFVIKRVIKRVSLRGQFLSWLKSAITENTVSINQSSSSVYRIEVGTLLLLNELLPLFLKQQNQSDDKKTFFNFRKKLIRQLKQLPDIYRRSGGSIVCSYYRGDDEQKIKLSGIILPTNYCFENEQMIPAIAGDIHRNLI